MQVNVADADPIATGNQFAASVASDGRGGIIVAWQSEDQEAGGYDIAYRLGSVDGSGDLAFSAEGRANTAFVAGDQTAPAVAMDATGDFVLAWQSQTGDEVLGLDIHYKRGSLAGLDGGDEIVANSFALGDQLAPAASIDAVTGDFVIAWQGPAPVGPEVLAAAEETEVGNVWLKVFKAGTSWDSGDVPVNADSYNDPCFADVAIATDGTIVVVWQVEGQQGSGSDVFGRRFGFDRDTLALAPMATADASTGDFRLNQTVQRPQRAPTVGIDDDGDFFAAWQSQNQDGFSWGIYGRRYDASGDAFSGEFLVNEDQPEGPQIAPAVAVAPNGRSVTAWIGSFIPPNEDEGEGGRQPAVRGRIYDDAGAAAVGGELLLATFAGPAERPAATAANAAGNFVVAWQSINQEANLDGAGTSWGVYARQFVVDKAAGTISSPQPQEFRVNEVTDGPQRFPSVGAADAGQFVVSWQSIYQDGSSWGVLQRQYLPDGTPAGGETLVNTATAGPQVLPVVAQVGSGDVAIIWSGKGLEDLEGNWGQRYRWIADDFSRGDAPTLGPKWTARVGSYRIDADRAAVATPLGLVGYDGVVAADVAVEGFVSLGGGATAYQGLFARYGGPGDRNMYVGSLVRESGAFSGKIWRNLGGRWTLLASAAAAGGEGLLRFEVFGDSLKLFLDGDLVTWANDRGITRAGAIGMRGSAGTAVDEFTFAKLVPITPQRSPLAFRDFFDSSRDGTQLSRFWDTDAGLITMTDGRAVPVGSGASVASLNGVRAGDVSLRADVDLGAATGSSYIGLTARYAGPGDASMYVGSLVREGGVVTGKIWRNLSGTWRLLGQGNAPAAAGGLRFDVVGNALALSLDGTLLATASDSALRSGSVGLRGSGPTVAVDAFEAFGDDPPPPAVVTLPFADDFEQSGSGLSSDWRQQAGTFVRVAGAAVPIGSAVALATLNGVSVADVSLAADVAVDATAFSFVGLAARSSGPGDTNQYVGSLVRDAAGLTGKIWRNLSGRWTLLAEGPAPAATGTLRFDVVGTSLTLSLDGTTLAAATDSAIGVSGSVGMRGLGEGARVDAFRAA